MNKQSALCREITACCGTIFNTNQIRLAGYMTGYELYHDESTKEGYWHGMLLVPIEKKEALINCLVTARTQVGYTHKISFKKINRAGAKYDLANAWLSIAVGFLRSSPKGLPYYYCTGEKNADGICYQKLDESASGVRFILFRERENHEDMLHYPDETSKIETSFRMGFKGGLHFLFSYSQPARITRLHFDGFQHHGRHMDKQRVVDRLTGLREYCCIESKDDLIDDRGSDPGKDGSQDFDDCQLLQLTDLLIGSFRSAFGYYSNESQWKLAKYARTLINRYIKGSSRMEQSRWNHAFCLSQCYLADEKWQFETIELLELQGVSQPKLLE